MGKQSSWKCKGCKNICHMIALSGEIGTYCRVIYDHPDNKGTKWIDEDTIICLDRTEDRKAEDTQVRLWFPPRYERRSQ